VDELVVAVQQFVTDTLIVLDVGAEQIRCTMDHPFWVVGRGWVPAQKLSSGDELVSAGGMAVFIIQTWIERLPRTIRVFNVTVDGNHTYYIGRSRILVHNKNV
jgi:hypothetical protein